MIDLVIALSLFLLSLKECGMNENDRKQKFQKTTIGLFVVLFSFMAAYKLIVSQTDADGYWGSYTVLIPNMSFREILERWPDNPLYYILCKIFSSMHFSGHLWFGVLEFFFLFSFVSLLFKFSPDYRILGLYCFFVMGLFSFSLSASKQTLAMAFSMLSMAALIDKKYLRFLLLLVLAFLSHKSSLIVFAGALLWLAKNKEGLFWAIVFFLVIVFAFLSTYLLNYALLLIDSDHYTTTYFNEQAGLGNITLLLLYLLVFVSAILGGDYYLKESNESWRRFLLGSSILCVASQTLTSVNADLFRLAYYIIPLLLLYLVTSFSEAGNRGLIIKYALTITLLLYFVYTSRNSNGFHFMWQ